MGCTSQRGDIGGRELYGEGVAELCDHFECMSPTGDVRELDAAWFHIVVVVVPRRIQSGWATTRYNNVAVGF